jgi:hypothetical protein
MLFRSAEILPDRRHLHRPALIVLTEDLRLPRNRESGESLIFQRFIPRQTPTHANHCLLECFNRGTRTQRDVEHDLAGIEEHGQRTRGCQALTFRRPR